jgi:hypothetical protein
MELTYTKGKFLSYRDIAFGKGGIKRVVRALPTRVIFYFIILNRCRCG